MENRKVWASVPLSMLLQSKCLSAPGLHLFYLLYSLGFIPTIPFFALVRVTFPERKT